jgi:hypothetical protein
VLEATEDNLQEIKGIGGSRRRRGASSRARSRKVLDRLAKPT